MRKVCSLLSVAIFSLLSFISCNSEKEPEPNSQVQVPFTFKKGDIYIFQQNDGVSKNLISRIYHNGETWKREVVLKDLPFFIWDMAIDTKNNWLYVVASDKVIYRIQPTSNGKPEKILDFLDTPSSISITINSNTGKLYIGSNTQGNVYYCDLTGKNIQSLPIGANCFNLDIDEVQNYLYYSTNEGAIYYEKIGQFKPSVKVASNTITGRIQVYPGNVLPGQGLYYVFNNVLYKCDKYDGSSKQALLNGIDINSPIILSAEKNLIFHFKNTHEMYAFDLIKSINLNKSLDVAGNVMCGVVVN